MTILPQKRLTFHAGSLARKSFGVHWQPLSVCTKTQAKHQWPWILDDTFYFIACNFDFGLAYAAARVAWKHFNEHSVDSNIISIQRGQWHKHAQMLDKVRSKVIEVDYSSSRQELIILRYLIMLRRLWDLKSNHVVDFRMLHAAQRTIKDTPTLWAVSHS